MKWVDVLDIGIALSEKHAEINPMTVNFVNLREFVIQLDEFDDEPERCNERILEAIQQAWIDEAD
ncbi:MAG: Fe-S cluster assembly protein IscX [Pseudomonadota bacterium]